MTNGSKARSERGMRMSPEVAESIFWWANWMLVGALVVGVLATYAIVVSGSVKDAALKRELAAGKAETSRANETAAHANARAAELEKEAADLKAQAEADRLARLKIEARLAPRSITQQQQHELTAKLSEFKDVRGTVVALPSTPESEMFARVLTAPLKAAGWSIAIVAGERDGMMLHPKGVIVQYPMDLATSTVTKDGKLLAPPGPWNPLVDALNEFGIAASAIPWPMQPPDNIGIIISER